MCIKYTDPFLEMPLQTPAEDKTAFSQHASNQGSINKPAGFMQKARVYISNFLNIWYPICVSFLISAGQNGTLNIWKHRPHYVKNEPSYFVATVS